MTFLTRGRSLKSPAEMETQSAGEFEEVASRPQGRLESMFPPLLCVLFADLSLSNESGAKRGPFRSTNELCSNFAERFSPLKNDDKTFYSVFITHKDPYRWLNRLANI